MKRSNIFICCVIVAFLVSCMIVFPCAAIADDNGPDRITVAVIFGEGDERDTKYLQLARELEEGLSVATRSFEIKYFRNYGRFIEAVKKDRPELVFAGRRYWMYEMINVYGYQPFISIFPDTGAVESRDRLCFFIKKAAAVDASALSGKRAAIARNRMRFYAMRLLIGARPDRYFSGLAPHVNDFSALYSVAFGEADTAFAAMSSYEVMKFEAPGAVEDLRPLECGSSLSFLPVLKSGSLDIDARETAGTLNAFIDNKYRPGGDSNTIRIRTSVAVIEDFTDAMQIIEEANLNYWNVEYEEWVRTSGASR